MTDIEIIDGHSHINVTKTDGTVQKVRVLELPVASWSTSLEFAEPSREAEFVELVSSQDKGWAASLKPASYHALVEKAKEVNLYFFEAFRRRTQANLAMMPEAMRKAMLSAAANHRIQ